MRAFGTYRATTGSTVNNFRYIGRLGYYRETAISGFLLRRRYYAPEVGRFVSPDPLWDSGLRVYAYVGNRPTTEAHHWLAPEAGAGPPGQGALQQMAVPIVLGEADCDTSTGQGVRNPINPQTKGCLRGCVERHEQNHANFINNDRAGSTKNLSCCARAKKCREGKNKKGREYCDRLWGKYRDKLRPFAECAAYSATVDCLIDQLKLPMLSPYCQAVCRGEILEWTPVRDAWCAKAKKEKRPACIFNDDGTPNEKWLQ
jgi:RHS repeat-associated protein